MTKLQRLKDNLIVRSSLWSIKYMSRQINRLWALSYQSGVEAERKRIKKLFDQELKEQQKLSIKTKDVQKAVLSGYANGVAARLLAIKETNQGETK